MISVDKEKSSPYAVVIGIDHFVGIQTARIFAQRGLPVIGIAKDPKHYCARTRVCERILTADTQGSDLIKTLVALGKKLKQKAVLVPCRDMSVLMISRNRVALEKYFYVLLPDPEVVEMLMDKPSFYDFASKENLPLLKNFMLHNKTDAEKAAQSLNFPCILKPPVKTPTWEMNTKVKAFKSNNAEEFLKDYDRCSKWAELLMVQEWIAGSDEDLYSCNCYFNKDSEPLVTFTAKKLRQWPPETGNTSLGQECKNDFVLKETIRLFKKVHFYGLGYLEMKRDQRNGKYYIIEPNIGRPTGRSALAEASGVELLYTMYCDTVGWPLPENRVQKFLGVKWVHLRTDFQSALHYWLRGNLTIKSWRRSLRGRKAYAILSWYDPLPFFEQIRLGFWYFIVNIFKKSKKYDF